MCVAASSSLCAWVCAFVGVDGWSEEVLDLKNCFLWGKAIGCTRITYSQRRQYTTQLFVQQRGHHEKIYSVPKDHRTRATPSLPHARMRPTLSPSYFWMLPQKYERERWHVLNRNGWMRCGEKKEGRRNMGRGSLKQRRWETGKYKEEDIHIVCRVCVCEGERTGEGGKSRREYLTPEHCFLAVWRLWECFVEGFPYSASFIFGGSCWTIERPVEIYTHTHTAVRARSSAWPVNKTYIRKTE